MTSNVGNWHYLGIWGHTHINSKGEREGIYVELEDGYEKGRGS
jgi:hypothetical protein